MPIPYHPLKGWLDNVALAALSSRDTLQSTYDIANLAIMNAISGDFVECGVFGGAQCAAMARVVMDWKAKRKVHLFDSFEGIPQAGPHDTEFLKEGHRSGLSACSSGTVRAHMAEWGVNPSVLEFHEGPLSDTVWREDAPAQIAFLRLDVDLYESTLDALKLLRHVSPGGYIVCDDFDLSGARKAVLEEVGQHFGPVMWRKKR